MAEKPATQRPAGVVTNSSTSHRGVGRLIYEAERAFGGVLLPILAAHELTLSQWFHLRELWNEDGIAQVELSRRLGLEKASSTAVLETLEFRRLIQRERSQTDRRKADVQLTADGRQLTGRIMQSSIALNMAARHGISDSEFATFLMVLSTMTANLNALRWQPPSLVATERSLPDPKKSQENTRDARLESARRINARRSVQSKGAQRSR